MLRDIIMFFNVIQIMHNLSQKIHIANNGLVYICTVNFAKKCKLPFVLKI